MKPEGRTSAATPKNTSALVATMSAPLQSYLTATLGRIEATADDEDSLWQAAARGLQMEMAGRLLAGKAYFELSTRVEKKQLVETITARGIQLSSFYQLIGVYQSFDALTAIEQVEALASLGFTKNRLMASWQPEERLALANGDAVRGLTLELAADMPSRDFEKAIKPPAVDALEKQVESLKVEVETAENLRLAAEQALSGRATKDALPVWHTALRQEAAATHATIAGAVDLFEQVLADVPFHPGSQLLEEQAVNVVTGAFHLLQGEHARIGRLLARMAEQFESGNVPAATVETLYSTDERAIALATARGIFSALEQEATRRAEVRDASVPRGRGRPPKTEAKTIRKGKGAKA